jgi:hypothetical protein
MTADIQLDIFGALEEVTRASLPLCLYRSPARGPAARAAEFGAWKQEHGSFGSRLRAHAWVPDGFGDDVTPSPRCQATTLSVNLRPDDAYPLACRCTEAGALLYRGACRHCDWEGPEQRRESPAAEDALDHAWPGWRVLPVLPPFPGTDKARPAWLEKATAAYPAGWLEAGGPVRTQRTGQYDTRHVPCRGPFGGYDAGVVVAEAAAA